MSKVVRSTFIHITHRRGGVAGVCSFCYRDAVPAGLRSADFTRSRTHHTSNKRAYLHQTVNGNRELVLVHVVRCIGIN